LIACANVVLESDYMRASRQFQLKMAQTVTGVVRAVIFDDSVSEKMGTEPIVVLA
jgi:hypothetical protein